MATNKPRRPKISSARRHNIYMDATTRDMSERLAKLDNRSVSNLLAVLVIKEWQRRQAPAAA